MMWRRVIVLALAFAVLATGCRATRRRRAYRRHLDEAKSRQRAGDLAGALRALDQAVALKPKSGRPLVRRGMVKARMKDPDGARADFAAAIKHNPMDPLPYYSRGKLSWAQGDRKAAFEDVNQAIELASDIERKLAEESRTREEPSELLPKMLLARGEMRGLNGDIRGAIEDFSKAGQLQPDLYKAFLQRAYAYRALKEMDLAISDLEYVCDNAFDPVTKKRAKDLLAEIRRGQGG